MTERRSSLRGAARSPWPQRTTFWAGLCLTVAAGLLLLDSAHLELPLLEDLTVPLSGWALGFVGSVVLLLGFVALAFGVGGELGVAGTSRLGRICLLVIERPPGHGNGTHPLRRHNQHHLLRVPDMLLQPRGNRLPYPRTLLRRRSHQRHRIIVHVQSPFCKLWRHRLPWSKVDHVRGPNREHIRYPGLGSGRQTRGSGAHDPPYELVGDFRRGQVQHGVKPANLVGAIANEAGLDSQYIGRIEIFDDYSTLSLPVGMPRSIFRDLQKTWVCGQQLRISKHQGEAPPPKKPGKRG